jgi:hypothetical protein
MLHTITAAAARHHGSSIWPLLAAALVAAVCYLVACSIWPQSTCGKCGGAGGFASPTGKARRPCRRCGGTGYRQRLLSRTRDRD